MAEFDFDAVVVGAGAVGLACGYALSRRGLSVAVLEQEGAIGQGVSSRNSEVIHAGIYYPTGSLKARLCVAGRRALYRYCTASGVEHRQLGKLIVATSEAEVPTLRKYCEQAEKNGVNDLSPLTAAEVKRLEPSVRCAAA